MGLGFSGVCRVQGVSFAFLVLRNFYIKFFGAAYIIAVDAGASRGFSPLGLFTDLTNRAISMTACWRVDCKKKCELANTLDRAKRGAATIIAQFRGDVNTHKELLRYAPKYVYLFRDSRR